MKRYLSRSWENLLKMKYLICGLAHIVDIACLHVDKEEDGPGGEGDADQQVAHAQDPGPLYYCMSKKSWPVLYCKLLYKIGQNFLGMGL